MCFQKSTGVAPWLDIFRNSVFNPYVEYSHKWCLAGRNTPRKPFFQIRTVPVGIGMTLNKQTKLNRNTSCQKQKKINVRRFFATVFGRIIHGSTWSPFPVLPQSTCPCNAHTSWPFAQSFRLSYCNSGKRHRKK